MLVRILSAALVVLCGCYASELAPNVIITVEAGDFDSADPGLPEGSLVPTVEYRFDCLSDGRNLTIVGPLEPTGPGSSRLVHGADRTVLWKGAVLVPLGECEGSFWQRDSVGEVICSGYEPFVVTNEVTHVDHVLACEL